MRPIQSLRFRIALLFTINRIKTESKDVFLTFDDGPEPGITEFVVDILSEYEAKATFFCTGKNCYNHPELVKLLLQKGHSLGNHTYSHLNGLKEKMHIYLNDVYLGKELIQSNLFRPPWGAISLRQLCYLKRNNHIVLWSIESLDSKTGIDWKNHCEKMVKKTKPGSIVLFHFSKKHATETMRILPMYLNEINVIGFKSKVIQI